MAWAIFPFGSSKSAYDWVTSLGLRRLIWHGLFKACMRLFDLFFAAVTLVTLFVLRSSPAKGLILARQIVQNFVLPQFWCSFHGSFLWEEVQILFRVINGRCRCNWHQYFLFFFFLRNSFLSFCLYFFYFALTEVLVYEYIF